MEQSPRLSLSYVAPAQAQKHVTVNETFRRLDALVQMTVKSRDVATEPTAPAEGDGYILPASPTGEAWENFVAGGLAFYQDGAWAFVASVEGMRAYVVDEGDMVAFDGAAWSPIALGEQAEQFGVNTTADETNRLSVKSDAVLFSHDDVTPGSGDAQVKVNKAAPGDTASHLFQTGFSGRAEFGLTGDDDFRVKVSPDGSNWTDAMRVNKDTGRVNFPSGGVRNQLTAPRTYYVSASGSDANDGLTSGAPFFTVQKAVDVVASLDIGIYDVTIQLADGTYNLGGAGVELKSPVGSGRVIIQGNASTPSDVIVKTSGGAAVNVFRAKATETVFRIKDMKLESAATSGACRGIFAEVGAIIEFENLVMGAFTTTPTGIMFHANDGGQIEALGGFEIAGGCRRVFQAAGGGVIRVAGKTITLTGAPAWSEAFLYSPIAGVFIFPGNTFSGSATGVRYNLNLNAVATTSGATLPGDVAGTTATGAQYL